MQFRNAPKTRPTVRPSDLPTLPTFHTPEELATWRHAVAQLPALVEVPPVPDDPGPEALELQRQYGKVQIEQRMQAEAERLRTDPREVQKRRDLVKLQVTQLDRMIEALQARRADVSARLILDEDDL